MLLELLERSIVPRYCPNFRRVLRRYNGDGIDAVPSRCKSWLCPYCRVVNARVLRFRVSEALKELKPTQSFFVTLTAPGVKRTPYATYAALHRAWPIVRQYIRRHYGPFEYLVIFERHSDGAYHLHAIFFLVMTPHYPGMAAILQRVIKDRAVRWGIGYIADVREIEDGVMGAVRYASKSVTRYLSKGTQSTKDALPKGVRLFYLSRGIERVFERSDDGVPSEWAIGDLITEQLAMTIPVTALPLGRTLTSDDFLHSEVWPAVEFDDLTSEDF